MPAPSWLDRHQSGGPARPVERTTAEWLGGAMARDPGYPGHMLFLISLAAAARVPLVYQYSRPDAATDVAGSTSTRYLPKDEIFIANPEAALRAEASATAKLTWKFPLGTKVTVLAEGAPGVSGDFGGIWYQVQADGREGWVHNSDLTPYGWHEDLDGDGAIEVATVAFTSEYGIRVTVFEPDMKVANESWVDLETVGGAYVNQRGGIVRAELVPVRKAGIPLIQIHTGVEACADFADYWVAYRSPGKGEPGRSLLALQQAGLADPPNCSNYEVEFDARRHLAIVTRHEGGCSEEEKKPTSTEARWVLVDGVYRPERAGGLVR